MSRLFVSFTLISLDLGRVARRRLANDRGQATVEYLLVLLGAAALALLLVAAVAKSDRIGALLDAVFTSITGRIT